MATHKKQPDQLFEKLYPMTLNAFNMSPSDYPIKATAKNRWVILVNLWNRLKISSGECSDVLSGVMHFLTYGQYPWIKINPGVHALLDELVHEFITGDALYQKVGGIHAFQSTFWKCSHCDAVCHHRHYKPMLFKQYLNARTHCNVRLGALTSASSNRIPSFPSRVRFYLSFEKHLETILPSSKDWSLSQKSDYDYVLTKFRARYRCLNPRAEDFENLMCHLLYSTTDMDPLSICEKPIDKRFFDILAKARGSSNAAAELLCQNFLDLVSCITYSRDDDVEYYEDCIADIQKSPIFDFCNHLFYNNMLPKSIEKDMKSTLFNVSLGA